MTFSLFVESLSCNALYLSMVLTPFARAHARATLENTQKLVKYTWQSYAGVAGRGRIELGARHARLQH